MKGVEMESHTRASVSYDDGGRSARDCAVLRRKQP